MWSSDKSELLKKKSFTNGLLYSGLLLLSLSSCLTLTAVMPHAGVQKNFLFVMQLAIIASFNLLIYGVNSWGGYSIVIFFMTIFITPSMIDLLNGRLTVLRLLYCVLMITSAIVGYALKVKNETN